MSAPQPPTTPTKSTTTPPLYHPIYNPPYKISYGSELTGKIIRRSKRRITFQFGFSDPSAIAAGKKGLGCRGSEHEVIMTWSHISGTVEIIHDGRVVTNTHWSNSYAGNTRFNHSWMVGGVHQMEIVANASGTPKRGEKKKLTTSWGDVGGPSKEYRQFDLLLDGMSFFDFCEMSHLGKKEKH